MLKNIYKRLELIANVAIIVVSCLLASVLIKNHLLTKSKLNQTAPAANQPLTNPSVSSLDINWKQDRQTLILAISSSCQFCTSSAPFYKKLVQSRKDTRLVAILPQSVEEGQEYLKRLQVQVDEVRQVELSTIAVQGTPTLLLIDSAGVIKKSWIGQLSPSQESDVLNAIHTEETNWIGQR